METQRTWNLKNRERKWNCLLSGRKIYFLAQKDTHCGCFVLLTFYCSICTCHTQNAPRHKHFQVFSLLHCLLPSLFTRVSCFFFSSFNQPFVEIETFWLHIAQREKNPNNLDAKCMKEEMLRKDQKIHEEAVDAKGSSNVLRWNKRIKGMNEMEWQTVQSIESAKTKNSWKENVVMSRRNQKA